MEDRSRHTLRRLGILTLAGTVAFFLLDGPARARRGLRMIGLWTYLAVVYRDPSEAAVALDTQEISPDIDTVLPYWGAKPGTAAERSDERLAGTAAKPG